MHLLNKFFDKVVCINLLERPDKKKVMQDKFNMLCIKVDWYNAVQYGFANNIVDSLNQTSKGAFNNNQPNELGASLSHYAVIKSASIEGANKIFVFEDDVLFHNDFNNQLDKVIDKLPNDWDMIMLYAFMYNIMQENIRVNSRWVKAYKSWSLMSYGMNKNMMNRYISYQDKFLTIADSVTYNLQEDNSLNIYCTVPTLCIPSKQLGSNIRGNNMNYINTPTVLNMGINQENYI